MYSLMSFYYFQKYFQENCCKFYSNRILNIQNVTFVPCPSSHALMFWSNFKHNGNFFLQLLPLKIKIYTLKYTIKNFYCKFKRVLYLFWVKEMCPLVFMSLLSPCIKLFMWPPGGQIKFGRQLHLAEGTILIAEKITW